MRFYSFIFASTVLLLLAFSCSMSQESYEEDNYYIDSEPKIAVVKEQRKLDNIKGFIQSDKESILANSVECLNGKYILSISKEEADTLGIDKKLYSRYIKMVDNLNRTNK